VPTASTKFALQSVAAKLIGEAKQVNLPLDADGEVAPGSLSKKEVDRQKSKLKGVQYEDHH
jgi:hypothetical protein